MGHIAQQSQGQVPASEPEDSSKFLIQAPVLSLPKGGGAIRGIGEKFAANPVTGTGSMSVPIALSPGRSGVAPQLSLSYDSGTGNGPFGFGWSLALPQITRRTDKGLPQYNDAAESDIFMLSGAEDLVPMLNADSSRFEDRTAAPGYLIHRYRPRVEGLFARIERWTRLDDGDVHWRSISKDNVLTLYGQDAGSRIADPANTKRIFTWLICESRDDHGNAILYEFKGEDGDGVDLTKAHERNRGNCDDPRRKVNRYIKRIRYGNRTPLLNADGKRPRFLADAQTESTDWMFEVVFDYGEHDLAVPQSSEVVPWTHRSDAFSTYRAGFEVRTSRRCRRVLMFHHFEQEIDVGKDCLVRSTDFSYADELNPPDLHTPIHSFLRAVTQCGYRRQGNGYLKRSLPLVEFEYTQPVVQDTVQDVDAESLRNLPAGLDASAYQWTDLHGEGVPGLLTEQAGTWYYKRNLSPVSERAVEFAAVERVATRPNFGFSGGKAQFMDLAGDGQPDLVVMEGPTPGFHEQDSEEGWGPFRAFTSRLNRDSRDPNLRFIDLNGDGHADVLISEDQAFVWHASLAEEGFAPARRVQQALDEETGPRLVFADAAQSIYLADMSGDGLTDLVRIRNGEVCYWPNLGYGRFGAKVTMDQAPRFDRPDCFEQRRVRLADIDGSGAIDIIYLSGDGVTLYFNQSGNSWSAGQGLAVFPAVDDIAAIQVTDLMGNGTACLVWSSPLPGNATRPMRYVDLMGGQKPHLLVRSANNLGAETVVHYAPSTQFYLADKLAGKPWITKLPFPVHVVERVETFDRISGNRFVSRYAYHHGHFDGTEREFRGFGMVEQWDTEEFAALSYSAGFPSGTNIDASSHLPPVLTRSWFHTGIYLGREHVSNYFAGLLDAKDCGEYYREPGLNDAEAGALLLDDTVLPVGLSLDEEREACRALKGALLRQEVYALDGSEREPHPYAVTEQNFTVRVLQPQAGNRHGVFFSHAREALSIHYERNPADPRITHALTLEADDYGNVLKSAAVAYGRRLADSTLSSADQARQAERLVTCGENIFTNVIDAADAYRTPLPSESRSYELGGLELAPGATRLGFDQVLGAVSAAAPIAYEDTLSVNRLQKRLIEHVRTQYRPNDLGVAAGDPLALLPPGQLESLAIPGESYKLAFTPGLLAQRYGDRVDDAMLEAEARYVHNQSDLDWWLRSGRIFLSPDSNDDPAAELAWARLHGFLPQRFRSPFHRTGFETESVVAYDAYDLALRETRDALGNVASAVYDYRVLQPRLMTDPNGNRAEVAFDTLGMVVGTAVMGKTREVKGDSLDGFVADLDDATVLAHLADPLTDPHAILQRASTRLVVDLFAYTRTRDEAQPQPAVVYALARETHDADLKAGEQTRIQHAFFYSDGFGRENQKKIQAEPGPLVPGGTAIAPRWVGSGWTIFNNKGKPVRQYEPFFSATHHFEFARSEGVSPVLFYDPVGRVVATLHPNHTWEKVVFDPWRQESWDVTDTILIADPKDDASVSDYFRRLPDADYLPGWHAQRAGGAMGTLEQAAALKADVHAATPNVAHMDSLGRTFLTVAHNKFKRSNAPATDPPEEAHYATRIVFDIEGNQREVIDALDRIVMRYDYDMLGNRIHSASMEAGERWMLNDIAGKALYGWDSRDHRLRSSYDVLARPTEVYLKTGTAPELLVGRTIYGESQASPEANNLRGKPYQSFDGAGVVTGAEYDFKGNALSGSRQLAVDYKTTPDWSGTVPLEAEVFTTRSSFDALNRPLTQTTPDGSSQRRSYNEAGLLESVDANLRGEMLGAELVWQAFVSDVDYNAKGQRERIVYGNGVVTTYEYDRLTFRLVRLQTLHGSEPLQDLSYTYDPVGNITHIEDAAQQTIYFRNTRVDPSNDYLYDATYQLVEASGREHLGQASDGTRNPPTAPDAFNGFHTGLLQPGDGKAMGLYLERYVYDAVGNFLEIQHVGSDPTNPGWTRAYSYAEASLIEPAKVSNRLSSTQVGDGPIERYTYDEHGSMTSMPHLPLMQWNYRDQLEASARQVVSNGVPETTFYVYDASGQRVRKITERQSAPDATPTRMKERIYHGAFEIYREQDGVGTGIVLERETLHVMDDARRIAIVDTRTDGSDLFMARLLRFQLNNPLRSSNVELSEAGEVISYEEYFPYGVTSYQAVDSTLKATAKRYRYVGKERDEETGLDYYGARYYFSMLGRWCSADSAGTGILSLHQFVGGNPIRAIDPDGNSWIDAAYDSVASWSNNTLVRAQEAGYAAAGTIGSQAEWAWGKAMHPISTAGDVLSMHPAVAGWQAASQEASASGKARAFVVGAGTKNLQNLGGAALGIAQSTVAIGSIPRNEIELAWHVGTGSPAPTKTMRAAILNRPSLIWLSGGVDTSLEGTSRETVQSVEALGGALLLGAAARRLGVFESSSMPAKPVDVAEIGKKLDAAPGQRVFYVDPVGNTVGARYSGSSVTFDTQTSASFVEVALEQTGRNSPGTHTYLGSGTHGGLTGEWAPLAPEFAEHPFYLEDVAATGGGQLPTLGPRFVFDVAKGSGGATFTWAESTAGSLAPGSMTTMRAWCYSTLAEPMSAMPPSLMLLLPPPTHQEARH
jgi:RHS repeat-associated protein